MNLIESKGSVVAEIWENLDAQCPDLWIQTN
jgi:hypothetical protein